jgi:TctA family transporter
MQGISCLAEELLTIQEGFLLHEVGWLVGWFVGSLVGQSVLPEPVVLLLCFTFRMQKLKLKPLQWLGK